MSVATKKKHVAQEVLNQFELPHDDQQIVMVIIGKHSFVIAFNLIIIKPQLRYCRVEAIIFTKY